jgi:hypothetical protein
LSFKKPQLLIKSKLNKYIDDKKNNEDSSEDSTKCHVSLQIDKNEMKNLDNNQKTSNSSSIYFSQSSEYFSKFFFFTNQSKNTSVIHLRDLKIENNNENGNIIIKPLFELINIDQT